MTRVNVVPPSELCRQHLIAEIKEITRVMTLARKATTLYGDAPTWAKHKKVPENYVLGTGHVLFFVPRIKFLVRRYKSLCAEWRARGYSVNRIRTKQLISGIDRSFINDYVVTRQALTLNRARIALRRAEMASRGKP